MDKLANDFKQMVGTEAVHAVLDLSKNRRDKIIAVELKKKNADMLDFESGHCKVLCKAPFIIWVVLQPG